ncbi:MAG: AAA family ATPase [Oscillibacter sp.]|nr:AAA family ATPase [Oscillibacter sp.]
MLIREMTAVFGKLKGDVLPLREGLNVVEAPNESGKSTWCAFLLAMLFGVDTHVRARARDDFIPDKTRYAPWDGAAMSGRLDCAANGRDVTITRTTRRASSPMGEFQAVYTGTAEAVPWLSADNCGETLLGVSREVYERSAFIRQSALTISQSAELERRIAALITSGEEETSYTDAAGVLKAQLNRRRHNRTGRLPELEGEIDGTRQSLEALNRLRAEGDTARAQLSEADEEEARLRSLLALHDRADLWEKAEEKRAAVRAAEEAEARAARYADLLTESATPPKENLDAARTQLRMLAQAEERLAGARRDADNAERAQVCPVPQAERALEEAQSARLDAEDALERETRRGAPVPKHSILYVLGTLLPIVAAAVLFILLRRPIWWSVAAIGVLAAIFWLRASANAKKEQAAYQVRLNELGAALERAGERVSEAEAACEEARAQESAVKAAQDALSLAQKLRDGQEAELRRLLPNAPDLSRAEEYIGQNLSRYADAERMRQEAREASILAKALPEPEGGVPESPVERPAQSKADLTDALTQCAERKREAQRIADETAGRIREIGDAAELAAALERQEEEHALLLAEYDAIALAMEALSGANAVLQTRFSPQLAKRAAEIFSRITRGRYGSVALDREFHVSAEPTGDVVSRSAQLLSAGAADQLYLAARLAICDLVLPEETAAPLILDDALTNFDPDRCAETLRFLKEEAKRRQIVLFTCHGREAEFFADDPDVSVLRLGAAAR